MRKNHLVVVALLALTPSGEPRVLADDPCSLLTVQQVAEATGLDVTSRHRVPDIREIVRAQEQGREPGPGVICSYETASEVGALMIVLPTRSEQATIEHWRAFDRQRLHFGGSANVVRGLGQHAWTSGCVSVSVLVQKNARFTVSTQMYQPRSQEIVINVARAILRQLER